MNLCELVSPPPEVGGRFAAYGAKSESASTPSTNGKQTSSNEGRVPNTVLLSSAVASDGHEIQNIFLDKGFMAERFVKVRR